MNIRHFAGIIAAFAMLMTGNYASANSPGARELMPQQVKAGPHVKVQQAASDQVLTTRKRVEGEFSRPGIPMVDPMAKPSSQLLARRVAASKKKLRGALIFNLAWYDLPSGTAFPYGVYELSTTAGDAEYTPVILDEKFYVMDAVYTGSKYWITHAVEDPVTWQVTSMTYYTFNPSTWEIEKEQVGDKSLSLTTSTWDPVDEMAYCTWFENGKHVFGFLGIDDGQKYQLGTVTNRLVALSADVDGTLYAIDDKGALVEINKMTGKVARTIGQVGVVSYSRTSAVIDPATKIMYYVDCGSSKSALYAVDITTAESTKLYDFSNNEEFIGLYLEADDTPGTVPGAPVDATLEHEDGSLQGTVKFKVPTTFHDGTEASGDVSYTVATGEGDPVTAATTWGSDVSVPVSFTTPGQKSITITLTNANGTSKPAKVSGWFGSDVPAGVTGASATWAGGVFTIKWTAPTTGANGGWFDTSALRYDVVRVNDNVKIAEDVTATQVTDPVDEPVNEIVAYTYTITPKCNGVTGEPVTTSKKSIGYLLPPYSNSFDNSGSTAGYTVLDANKDSKKWSYNTSNACFRIQYNSSKAMDDYLFTPQMQLEAGRSYTFTFKARAHNNSDAENIEGVISTGTSVASVVATIIPNTQLTSKDWVTLSGTFTPATSGRYRFGFHAVSPKNSYYLYVDDLEVSAGAGNSAPASVEGLSVVPAADGKLSATVSFTTPSVDVSGAPIDNLTKVELSRDGDVINTWDAPAAGSQLSYTDTEVTAKNHAYSVVAYNPAGAGTVATRNVFVGYDAPEAPTNLEVSVGSNPGTAVITWSAPTKDLQGNTLKSSAITYNLVRRHGNDTETVATGLSGCVYTDVVVSPDEEQDFYDYGVAAVTTGGASTMVGSSLIPLGKPYELPFKESFGNARISSIWGLDSNNAAAGWMLGQDTSIDGIDSEDGDNGLAIMEGMTKGSTATLFSGSIAIPVEGNPTLAFAYYNHNSLNTLDVIVAETGSTMGDKLVTVTLDPSAPEGWVNVPLSLDRFKGKNIQIYLTATVVNTTIFVLDNVRVENRLDHNLSMRTVSMPARMTAGNDYEIVAVYENKGINPASDYQVRLSLNGEILEDRAGETLQPGQTASVKFIHSVLPTHDSKINIQAELVYDKDLDAADNLSSLYEARRVAGNFPVPEAPEATMAEEDVNVAWTEPDLSVKPMDAVTEDVDDFTPFSTGLAGSEVFDDYIGDWLSVDNDGVVPYDITSGGQTLMFPNYHRPIGFMVIDSKTFGQGWEAHSGDNMFASFASGNAPNDDWLISPLLSGEEQEIEFWARSVTTAYGKEVFEVYYSTTDTRLSSFTRCVQRTEAPMTWTKYTAILPKDARYFAIRCVSDNTFAFLLDDISFIPAHPNTGLTLTGYNLYRDGAMVNDQPLAACNYLDKAPAVGSYSYRLSAVYNRGESELSSPVTIEVSGVEDLMAAGIRVYAEGGNLVIAGAAGKQLNVSTIGGVELYNAKSASAEVRLSVAKNVYLVTVGGKTHKIIVK